jgi:hypothetical protein
VNPSAVTGYASPCPTFSLSAYSVPQSGTLIGTITPTSGVTQYIYTTGYVYNGSSWLPETIQGSSSYAGYSNVVSTLNLTSVQLSTLPIGTIYTVEWDWIWNTTQQCYLGPGSSVCNQGSWRLQEFALTAGCTASVCVSPSSLNFGSVNVGSTSQVQYVTVSNNGSTTLTFNGSFGLTGDFQFGGSGTCGATLPPAANCLISLKFTPTVAGTRTGTLTVADNDPSSPQTVALSGTGVSGGPTPTPSPTTCASNCYYLSPSGSNANSGTSASSPWATFGYAIPKLTPGSTLVLGNGTYNSSNSGFPSINCSSGAQNGTASSPITVQAQNERQAFIKGDGTAEPFKMLNCSYWNIVGLHIEDGDFANEPGGVGTNGNSAEFSNDSHLVIRRNIFARSNRYKNAHNFMADPITYSLVEQNECYYNYRHCFGFFGGSNNEVRQNYANSRGYWQGGNTSFYCSNCGDTAGFIAYGETNTTFENNITENEGGAESGGHDNEPISGGTTVAYNKWLGEIANGDQSCFVTAAHLTQNPHDISWTNDVCVNPKVAGVWSRSSNNITGTNLSLWLNSAANEGVAVDQSGTLGTPPFTFSGSNIAVSGGTAAYAFLQASGATGSADHVNSFGNYADSSGGFTLTNKTNNNPGLGSCLLWLPVSSPLKGAGADIGANVLYAYQAGALTSNRLWDPSTGAPLFAGATVAGLNDVAGSSLFDIATRLHIGSANGCSFPAGY